MLREQLGDFRGGSRGVTGERMKPSDGHRDLDLYFDKDSGLLVKVQTRKNDLQAMQEVDEERIIEEAWESLDYLRQHDAFASVVRGIHLWDAYLLLLVLGFVSLATAVALRRRHQPARLPLIYGALALMGGAALITFTIRLTRPARPRYSD